MSSNVPGDGEPEYLGSANTSDDRPRRRGKKTALIVAAAVAVFAAVGVGGWGVMSFLGEGSRPASAVPANAVAYVSIDLDPSASQKIEALRIFKKFPSLDKQLNLGSRDDVRRWVIDKIKDESNCDNLDYAADVKPWIGNRVGFAGVPDGDKVAPLVALQVSDKDAARKGMKTLLACSDSPDAPSGLAFAGDYMLLAETQKEADAFATDAEKSALEDDKDYNAWMDRVGDPGIVTMYAAPDALTYATKAGGDPLSMAGGLAGQEGMSSQPDQTNKQLEQLAKDFKGAAGVLRFKGGAIEASLASGGLGQKSGADATASADDVTKLPATTAAAVSVGLKDGWLDTYLDSMASVLGGKEQMDELFKQGEAETGLNLPEDIATLLGRGVSVAVDSSADFGSLTSNPDPSVIPFGARIKGDPDSITPIIDTLKQAAGPAADQVVVTSGDGVVAIGMNQEYVDRLAGSGKLGDEAAFKSAVPDADKAAGVFYVNFDAGDWVDSLADALSGGDDDVTKNVAPLKSVGISGWVDDDHIQHALFRLTTD